MISSYFSPTNDTLLTIYSTYFLIKKNLPEIHNKNDFSLQKVNEWVKLSVQNKDPEKIYKAYSTQFDILIKNNKNELAYESAERSSYYANIVDNKLYKIESLLNTATCLELQNKKSYAYRNYLDAYYFSLEISNKIMVSKTLNSISYFFKKNRILSKAKKYKLLEISYLIENYKPIDSVEYNIILTELADILFGNNERKEALYYSNQIISYNKNRNNLKLREEILKTLRAYYFENNQLDSIYNLYKYEFPEELNKLKESNTVAYFRIQSLFKEKENKRIDAEHYLDSAEVYINKENKSVFEKCNFYNRKGEFYVRQHQYNKAITNFLHAFDFAKQSNYYPFLIKVSKNLDSVYTLTNNFKAAHTFGSLTLNYKDSLNNSEVNNEMELLEIENVEKQKELIETQHANEIKRKHKLQYILIVLLIISGLILLIFAGAFHIHKFVIKALGYIVFIFLFEFIILLADNKIHHLTHGEPLKIMGLKIVLIAILLPLHHWVEETVVHYLLHHRIIDNVNIRVAINNLIKKIKLKIQGEKTVISENEPLV
jgi:hypothetical protein